MRAGEAQIITLVIERILSRIFATIEAKSALDDANGPDDLGRRETLAELCWCRLSAGMVCYVG